MLPKILSYHSDTHATYLQFHRSPLRDLASDTQSRTLKLSIGYPRNLPSYSKSPRVIRALTLITRTPRLGPPYMHKQQAPRTNIICHRNITLKRSHIMPALAPVKPTTNFHTSTRLSSPHVASSVTPWTRSRQPTHHSVTIQVAHNVHHPMAALHLVRHLPARFHIILDIPTVYVSSPLEFIAVDYNNTHLTGPEPQQIGPHFNLSSVESPGGSQSPQPSSHQVATSAYKTPLYSIISGLL